MTLQVTITLKEITDEEEYEKAITENIKIISDEAILNGYETVSLTFIIK